jgi:hypothetical protein
MTSTAPGIANGQIDTMTHSSRQGYKEKANHMATYRQALAVANTAICGLEAELSAREEREQELLEVIGSLCRATKLVSGTLAGTVGDFGRGESPDRAVDENLHLCRPALIAARATAILLHANRRLGELHLEHEDAEAEGEALLANLALLAAASEASRLRRQKLLITGLDHGPEDDRQLADADNEYTYDKGGPTLDEIYGLPTSHHLTGSMSQDGNSSDESGDEPHLTGPSRLADRHRRAKERYTRRTGNLFK